MVNVRPLRSDAAHSAAQMSTTPPAPSLRRAQECDIPAILALLLTSFRQFPLFTFLYAPLDTDKDAANDTVFYWRRRLLVDLLDPAVTILVAEVLPETFPATTPTRRKDAEDDGEDDGDDNVEQESWNMFGWVTRNGHLSQSSKVTPGTLVVGFAIWKDRLGHGLVDVGLSGTAPVSWSTWLQKSFLSLEGLFWSKVYTRRDQDRNRYLAYLDAEESLSQRFYSEPCYYLDNLCVDFRYQRLGIGKVLLEWGITEARRKGLPVGTEASVKGEGLYRKMRFEQVGIWTVATEFKIPVMRLAKP